MSTQNRRFTNKQVAAVVVALCLGCGLAPAGAVVARQVFSIADPVDASHKARVNAKGGLAVTARDGATGAQAKIDSGGHALVGDGHGALTVDGSVQAVTPTETWSFTNASAATYYNLTPPKDVAVNVSTLFLGGDQTTTFAYLAIYAATAPASATTGCKSVGVNPKLIWQGEAYPDPVTVTFAVPLRSAPPAGKKICLYAYLNHQGDALFDVNGYYG
jgi:hypothetical protein